jgi:trans-2,3-dihydro-3-hydroxyanthranilate isomerase
VFVFPPVDSRNTRALRIFTPGMELPFAGHPTIGTAFILSLIGEVALDEPETSIVLEEGVGPVLVTIRASGGRPTFAQLTVAQQPEFGDAPLVEDLAALLELTPEDVLTGTYSPQAVSCGVPFLFVTVRDRGALARARLRVTLWAELLADAWAPHVYVLTADADSADYRVRMFAPAMNIVEDPATGAAAAALAAYLGMREPGPSGTYRWTVEQGIEMGRPSMLDVEADKEHGSMTAIRVGGRAVMVAEAVMTIPATSDQSPVAS